MNKKCPHCGQPISDAAFKCNQCKKWVPNELFNMLCVEDVELIKNSDLTPFTPSLIAIEFLGVLKNNNTKKQLQEMSPRKLSVMEEFYLLVFQSFCYYDSIRLNIKTKRGCKETLINTLKEKLMTLNIELFDLLISGIESGVESKDLKNLLRVKGVELYNQLDSIGNNLLATGNQQNTTLTLASALFGDKNASIFNGLPLYAEFITVPTVATREGTFKDMFLVEEKDFDWQAMIGDRDMHNVLIDKVVHAWQGGAP